MAHHGNDPSAIREMNQLTGDVRDKLRDLQGMCQPREFAPLGATNKFPQGKLNQNDEGEIMFAVAADKTQGKVLINFGKPVAWVGMDREQAIDLANSIRQKADDLLDISK
jgi:hypothetical protein